MDEFYLYNTGLPVLKIEYEALKSYDHLGSGAEGFVKGYDEKTAVKIFKSFDSPLKKSLKFRKLEILGEIKDPSFMFPEGLVGYEDERKEGYYRTRVFTDKKFKNLVEWRQFSENGKTRMKDLLIKGDAALQRLHGQGIYFGDIKGDNILISEGWDPIFIDVDNVAVQGFGFDVVPYSTTFLKKTFNKDFSLADIDKYLYAMLSLQMFLDGTDMHQRLYEGYVTELVRLLRVNPAVKEALHCIFSDADCKPYIGEILREVDVEEVLLSASDAEMLNKRFI